MVRFLDNATAKSTFGTFASAAFTGQYTCLNLCRQTANPDDGLYLLFTLCLAFDRSTTCGCSMSSTGFRSLYADDSDDEKDSGDDLAGILDIGLT